MSTRALPTTFRRWRVYALAMLVCFLWGSSFVLTKVALQELGPMTVAFGRWALAGLAFLVYIPLAGFAGEVRRALRADLGAFLVLGFVGISLFYALQNLGLQYSTAVNVGWVINLTTIFIAVLGVWWLGERLTPIQVIGIVVAFAGVTLISWRGGGIRLGVATWRGDLLTVLAALCAAIYTVYGKRVVALYSPAVVTALASLFGSLFLWPIALWEGWPSSLSSVTMGALVVLGLGSGALANLWWWRVLSEMDAARAGTYLLAIPLVSTALGVSFLGEPFTVSAAMGALLILAGLGMTQSRS